MPNVDQELLHHPYWKATDPAEKSLVLFSSPFPPELNPFYDDRVVIRAAGTPGAGVTHSKTIIGRAAVLEGVKQGRIHRKDPATGQPTVLVEATSANTGEAIADATAELGLKFLPIMKSDTPPTKVEALIKRGRGSVLELPEMLHTDLSITTVEKARQLGEQPGYCNMDQYGGDWNPETQKRYLGPALIRGATEAFGGVPGLIALPAGTMGTSLGLQRYVEERHLSTVVLPVMCAPKAEVPGARTEASILKDICLPWQEVFQGRVAYGPRYESFLLSYLAWPVLPVPLGPSFGLGYYGALSALLEMKRGRRLHQFREQDGTIRVVLFGPDSSTLYQHLYPAVLTYEDHAQRTPVSLTRLFGV